jgi:hypothetical protein
MSLDMFSQGIINQRLVITPTRLMHNLLEMLDDVGIQSDCNAHLVRIRFNNRASVALTEIFTHDSTPGKHGKIRTKFFLPRKYTE